VKTISKHEATLLTFQADLKIGVYTPILREAPCVGGKTLPLAKIFPLQLGEQVQMPFSKLLGMKGLSRAVVFLGVGDWEAHRGVSDREFDHPCVLHQSNVNLGNRFLEVTSLEKNCAG
jgi:hypothetical protein